MVFHSSFETMTQQKLTTKRSSLSIFSFTMPSILRNNRNTYIPELDDPESRALNLEDVQINTSSELSKYGNTPFGLIYKGNYKNNTVAVHRISAVTYYTLSLKSSIMDELEVLKQLKHSPYIARFYGTVNIDGSLGIVFKHINNQSLYFWIHHSKLRNDLTSHIVHGIAQGLTFLHSNNIPHGDITSKNVMLDSFFTPKLINYHLPFIFKDIEPNIPYHLATKSPEFCWSMLQNKQLSFDFYLPSDVYSLTILIGEIYTKSIPWHKQDENTVLEQIFLGKRPFIGSSLIPHNLLEFMQMGWAQDPLIRPQIEKFCLFLESLAWPFQCIGSLDQQNNEQVKKSDEFYKKGVKYRKNQDYKNAKAYYVKSADLGNSKAMHNIGYLYSKGLGVKQDLKKAFLWYTKSASHGNPSAMFNIARRYDTGLGIHKDVVLAMKWYLESAKLGEPFAMTNIGRLFEEKGASQDYEEALIWYNLAAEYGDAHAKNSLGKLYTKGLGVEENESKAVEWYTKGADSGNAAAMCNLGIMYRDGNGVVQCYEKAIELLTKSKDMGNLKAKEHLKELLLSMAHELND